MNKLQPECGFAQRVLTQADRARNPSQSGCHAIPIQCQQDQIVFCAAPTTHHRGESRSSYSRDAAAALPRRDAIPVTLKTRTPLWSATITTSPHLTSRPGAATRTPLTRTWPAIASDAAALRVRTMRAFHNHRSIRCRSPDTRQPASAALLGVRLKLGLEGRKLGKRRVWVGLLLALAVRGVVATILVVGSGFHEMRPLAAPALGTITLTFGTMLGAMISLAPLAAVVAFAPQLALRPARATMPCSFLFDWRTCLDDGLGSVLRRNGALRRCVRRWRPTVALARPLPLGRAPLAAPLFAAAARPPYVDEFRLHRRPGHLGQLWIDSRSARRRYYRGIGAARLRYGRNLVGCRRGRVGHAQVLRNCRRRRGVVGRLQRHSRKGRVVRGRFLVDMFAACRNLTFRLKGSVGQSIHHRRFQSGRRLIARARSRVGCGQRFGFGRHRDGLRPSLHAITERA